jgi:uncharacterized protein YlzI (FlbEa/FlbD family)
MQLFSVNFSMVRDVQQYCIYAILKSPTTTVIIVNGHKYYIIFMSVAVAIKKI